MDILEKHRLNEETWKAATEPLTHDDRCRFAFALMGAIECHMDPQTFREIVERSKQNLPYLFQVQP